MPGHEMSSHVAEQQTPPAQDRFPEQVMLHVLSKPPQLMRPPVPPLNPPGLASDPSTDNIAVREQAVPHREARSTSVATEERAVLMCR